MSMNKPELIDCIAKKGNISKVEAKKALELTIEAISEALAKGEDVALIGFGTFKVTELAERTGYTKTDNRYYWAEAGVFLSVDPMASERSWVSPYSYCQNNPMNRIDPTGALDVVDGYKDGQGNYKWFDEHTEASFTEGNSTWTKVTSNKSSWNEATTIRNAVIAGLVKLGNNEANVKKDVNLFSSSSPLFTKEVQVSNAGKYTSGWEQEYNSETGKYDASQSTNINNTGYSLKYYPTKGGVKGANAMGLVKYYLVDHTIESGMEYVERLLFGSSADNDPISDMHYGNAKGFLNSVNRVNNGSQSTFNWTDAIYFKTGGMK